MDDARGHLVGSMIVDAIRAQGATAGAAVLTRPLRLRLQQAGGCDDREFEAGLDWAMRRGLVIATQGGVDGPVAIALTRLGAQA